MTDRPQTTANSMWGGRFAAGPDAIMEAINASIGFDRRLYAQDIRGSRAHAAMLAAQGIISPSDAEAIGEGLLTVLSEIEGGQFRFQTALEDIRLDQQTEGNEVLQARFKSEDLTFATETDKKASLALAQLEATEPGWSGTEYTLLVWPWPRSLVNR